MVFQLILGQTGKPAVGFVHPGYDPVPIGEAHGIVRVVPDAAKQRLGAYQRLLGKCLFPNIASDHVPRGTPTV